MPLQNLHSPLPSTNIHNSAIPFNRQYLVHDHHPLKNCPLSVTIFHVWPISYNWVSNWDQAEPGTTIIEFARWLALTCTELFVDVVTLVLPWPVIWKLQVSTGKKWIVSEIVMLGRLLLQIIFPCEENLLISVTQRRRLKCLPNLLQPRYSQNHDQR